MYALGIALLMTLGVLVMERAPALSDQERSISQAIEAHLHQQEADIEGTIQETPFFWELIYSLEEESISDPQILQGLQALGEKSYALYLYSGDSLIFWNQSGLAIAPKLDGLSEFPAFSSDHREDFILKKYPVERDGKTYEVFVKIPLVPESLSGYTIAVRSFESQSKVSENTIETIEGTPVCEVMFYQRKHAFGHQLLLLVMYLTLAISILVAAYGIFQALGLSGPVSALLLSGIILFLRFGSFITDYSGMFNALSLFEPMLDSGFVRYSPADLLIDSSLFVFLVSLAGRIRLKESVEQTSSFVRQLTNVSQYLLILLCLGLFSWIQRWLVVDTLLNLDLDSISLFNAKHLVCFASMAGIGFGIFILAYQLIRQSLRIVPNIYHRLRNLIFASALALGPLSILQLNIAFFGYYLALLSCIVLFDLFIENGSKSVIWVICWLLFASGFSAIQLYQFNLDKDLLTRTVLAKDIKNAISEGDMTELDEKLLEWLPVLPAKYSLGIYAEDQLEYEYNNAYDIFLPVLVEYEDAGFTELISHDRRELIYSTDGLSVLIGKSHEGPVQVISLFSFLFTLFSIYLFLCTAFNSVFRFLPKEMELSFSAKPSLRNRIQVAIVFLIILAFIIIGFVTVFYLRSISEDRDKKIYEEQVKTIATSLQQIQDDPDQNIKSLYPRAAKVAYAYNRKSKIFNANGDLMLQDPDSEMRSPSVKMSFFAKVILDFSNRDYYVEPAGTDSKTISRGFLALRDNEGHVFGYVEMPGMNMITNPEDAGSRFFSTLLNAYVFLFLIAVALAIAVANSITRPLSELREKLKQFKLGKKNEPIQWMIDDEIGTLIKDYNGMIEKLDESAQLLAITERDLAWREMAKQVAHEIKNPLTPMKLSIQYMQNALNGSPDKLKKLVRRVSSTLIEQIDNLSHIASEFSNFAKMPQADNEKVILNEVVASVHDLFRKREDMDVNLIVPIQDIYVFADRNQLIRVMNNIIKNAIQAIPNIRRGRIDIRLTKDANMAIIEVTDNGTGISKDMRDKVFFPNFTTKSSGTGLGLAISSTIVESFNGKLYFTTEENTGTTFFIEIPLMKLEDNFKKENRVLL